MPYAHAIFTLLEALRRIVRQHQKTLYGVLMKAAAQALMALAADAHYVGGRIGLLAVLHTWGGAMVYHPHVHCLVPAGGLSDDGQWHAARKRYLVPVRALSRLFRARFMALARKAHPELTFSQSLWDKDWVVYCKPAPQGGPKVLRYLGRYVHRVAISNSRILRLDHGQVAFGYKDSRTDTWKTTRLPVQEFMRRFLQHVLPKGFTKVRYYGLLSPTHRPRLRRLQLLLVSPEAPAASPDPAADDPSDPGLGPLYPCPRCGAIDRIVIGHLPRQSRAPPW